MDYRKRLYDHYVSSRLGSLAPKTVEGFAPREPEFNRLIRDHLPQDRELPILDLGCGHGTLVYLARKSGYRNFHGVDSSPEQVEAAERLGIEGVRQADTMDTLRSTPDNSQGAIVAYDMIEHLNKIELVELVDQVHRVLMPGGRWIVHAPNGCSPFVGSIYFADYTHEQAFTPESLSQLLHACGFSKVDFHEDVPVVHNAKSFLRFLVWKAIHFLIWAATAAELGVAGRNHVYTRNLISVAIK